MSVIDAFRMSPLTRRRFREFFKQRRARIGLGIFGVLFLLSMTSEIWSHQNPLILKREKNGVAKTYFPSIIEYPADEFGITDSFVIDYKALVEKDRAEGKATFALFPLNHFDPYIQTPDVLAPPSSAHWLGTDGLGRDVLARLLYGTRVSLAYGLLYWLFSFIIGIAVGSIQGFFGGRTDFFTERFKELGEIVPFLSAVIIINGLMKSGSMWITLFIIVFFGWMTIASQVRAQFLSLRRRDFTEAARALGAGNTRIIFSHILPNAITPVLTFTPFMISAGISILAALDFLGYGLNPPTPSLGELLQQGRDYIANAPWLIETATVALCLMLISINLVGEALRQAFDPRSN